MQVITTKRLPIKLWLDDIEDGALAQAKMAGILGAPRGKDDLDEAPGAYKDVIRVMANQEDLTRIMVRLRPLASIKG